MTKKVDYLMRSNSKVGCLLDCVDCGATAIALIDAENSNVHIKSKGRNSFEKVNYSENINDYTNFDSRFITRFNKVLMVEDPTPVCLTCLTKSFDPLIEKGKKKARRIKLEDAIIYTSYYTEKIYRILEHHFPLPVVEEEEDENLLTETVPIFSTGNVGDTLLYDEAEE